MDQLTITLLNGVFSGIIALAIAILVFFWNQRAEKNRNFTRNIEGLTTELENNYDKMFTLEGNLDELWDTLTTEEHQFQQISSLPASTHPLSVPQFHNSAFNFFCNQGYLLKIDTDTRKTLENYYSIIDLINEHIKQDHEMGNFLYDKNSFYRCKKQNLTLIREFFDLFCESYHQDNLVDGLNEICREHRERPIFPKDFFYFSLVISSALMFIFLLIYLRIEDALFPIELGVLILITYIITILYFNKNPTL